eukprot:SAG22_NODE_3579_length_1633_cov_1.118644_1_plen_198_part_10
MHDFRRRLGWQNHLWYLALPLTVQFCPFEKRHFLQNSYAEPAGPMGAGYTNYFVYSSPNAGHQSRAQAWIMVRAQGPQASTSYALVPLLGEPSAMVQTWPRSRPISQGWQSSLAVDGNPTTATAGTASFTGMQHSPGGFRTAVHVAESVPTRVCRIDFTFLGNQGGAADLDISIQYIAGAATIAQWATNTHPAGLSWV